MSFGANLQYLRSIHGNLTQEKLAERLGVSRQTVSKWEADDGTYPEMEKLFLLCDLFSCTLDALLRQNMDLKNSAYSPVELVLVERFRMARYVIISPAPEDDANGYMERWARRSGLLDCPGYALTCIGWDFPYLSAEQKSVYGLRGYVSACVLPEAFTPRCDGAQLVWQERGTYARITIHEPFRAPFDLIPNGYQEIFDFFRKSGTGDGFKSAERENRLSCFEHVYSLGGETRMDVYVAADAQEKTGKTVCLLP